MELLLFAAVTAAAEADDELQAALVVVVVGACCDEPLLAEPWCDGELGMGMGRGTRSKSKYSLPHILDSFNRVFCCKMANIMKCEFYDEYSL